LIKKIIKKLHREHGFSFRAGDVINYLRKNPHLLDLIKDLVDILLQIIKKKKFIGYISLEF